MKRLERLHLVVGGERDLAGLDSELLAGADQPHEGVAAFARDRVDAMYGHGGGADAVHWFVFFPFRTV